MGVFFNKIYIYLKQLDLLLQVNTNIYILEHYVHMLSPETCDYRQMWREKRPQSQHTFLYLPKQRNCLHVTYKTLCLWLLAGTDLTLQYHQSYFTMDPVY